MQFTVGPNGSVDLPDQCVLTALAQGWTVASDDVLAAQSADFLTQGLAPGFGPVFIVASTSRSGATRPTRAGWTHRAGLSFRS